jgi:hypothetical protein
MCSYMYTSPSPLTIHSMKSLKVVDSMKLERANIIHPAGPSYRPIPFRRSPENLDTGFDSRYSVLFINCQVMIKCLFRLEEYLPYLRRRVLAFADYIAARYPSMPIGGVWILGFRLSVLNIGMRATKAATKHSTEAQVVRSN